ncbi:tRNA (adenosine(37)-N6)-threonylcarbamoyltransferase complex ATPase subunit type 1 TsaE [Litoribacter ruber]|uniref:tRNA threonylcarbamoyladenosine biosynthesis protein TsaE n=1 Tax=Litoribacter ruber TaxID=702568 RepID=A0AAP2CJF1_9BACT|nr:MULTISPECIES: tRNA (adenosine(37)-N6)-threonylcarbamoyltransferase complex ATPase subunit type 1 TsaE [Litoribacter]MBS9522882.1 tRNA (adenosine(37)-N6)-threonylcarbamoyltransferase complex ATPase subunit type 1 TsaE [Litoribacter alkaliphilus]MBT0812390.1 tRNA (adenosine(37)-N6)-threonylcarbamoyltransferase complex ATPase subunit type 1 TsaE [Litoribacter ruber]
MEEISYDGLEELPQVAKTLMETCKEDKIWVFKGDMGAGKTTLIKELARQHGVVDNVSSPTFSIVNEYQNTSGDLFYHFDFYRLDDPDEALEIGIDDYFYSGNPCWIEWGEKVAEYIPEDFVLIEINSDLSGKRNIQIKTVRDGS